MYVIKEKIKENKRDKTKVKELCGIQMYFSALFNKSVFFFLILWEKEIKKDAIKSKKIPRLWLFYKLALE